MSAELSRRQQYLTRMGIPVWLLRTSTGGVREASDAEEFTDDTGPTGSGWDTLQSQVEACRRCPLGATRNRSVFGTGDQRAKILIIGEAPGADEDRLGEPFVGRAGQLLNAMLKAIGLERRAVYITNILKCRPPKNRDPASEEIQCCESYLQRQIELIGPQVILASGRIAAQSLLGSTQAIGKLRGQIHRYGASSIPVVATYHPAYLLRSVSEKAKAWQDLKMLCGLLDGRADGGST